MSLSEFLESEVRPRADVLDRDRASLSSAIHRLVDRAQDNSSPGAPLLSNAELENVFAASATLGWTLWQHLAAVEILSNVEIATERERIGQVLVRDAELAGDTLKISNRTPSGGTARLTSGKRA